MEPELLLQLPAVLGPAAAALAGGAALARLSGPLACTWPARGRTMLARLNAVRVYRRPGTIRTVTGGVLLAALLAGASLTAYAAAPSAPERLPGEVQGVVGSGDQLSLRLKDAAGGRTIRPGEAYADGWGLKAVTATAATLTKDGVDRVVGLNPDGRVASAAAPAAPSTVRVAGIPDVATVDAYIAKGYAQSGPTFMTPTDDPGMRRVAAYLMMIQEEIDRRRAEIAAGVRSGIVGMNNADTKAFLGDAAYADYTDLLAKAHAVQEAQYAADLAVRPITGPASFYLPDGGNMRDAQAAAGVDPRGVWQYGPPDAQGGRTATRIATSISDPAARAAIAPPAPGGAP